MFAARLGPICRPARVRTRTTPCDLKPSRVARPRASEGDQAPSPPPDDNQEPSISGAPLPGADAADLQLPQAEVARLRDSVFGLDTLFVTSVENYGASGVLFRGNLRGDPAAARAKLAARLAAAVGDAYKLFLLEDQDDKPVAVVIPAASAEFQTAGPAAELAIAVGLGLATIATTLNINDAQLFNAALLEARFDPGAVSQALPAALATLGILAAHEAGHAAGAKKAGLDLAPPILIPAGLGLLGSFGAITRIRSQVPSREALATVAAPGPLAGAAASAAALLAGLALTAAGAGGVEVDSASFRESLLAGAAAAAVFGDRVFTAEALSCHPLFVAGWAGLIINAINCIPAGELDGGRLFLALFGRRAASRMSALSFFLLGIAGITSSLSLFWLLLVLTLQRGPIVPCDDELTPLPEGGGLKAAAFLALALPIVVLCPFPFAPPPPEAVEGLAGLPAQF